MITYKEKKRKILSNVNNFYCIDDLFLLAEASIIIKDLLKEQEFPVKEYEKWLKKQKRKFSSTI